eukprot:UN32292
MSVQTRKSLEFYDKLKKEFTDTEMVNKGGVWKISDTQFATGIFSAGITLSFGVFYCRSLSGLEPDVEEGQTAYLHSILFRAHTKHRIGNYWVQNRAPAAADLSLKLCEESEKEKADQKYRGEEDKNTVIAKLKSAQVYEKIKTEFDDTKMYNHK